jgi:hypothetical protein
MLESSSFASLFEMLIENEVKIRYTMSLQLLASLKKLANACVVLILTVIMLTVPLYSGFEFSSVKNDYKTHFLKYNYVVSGVFLKSESPAIALLCVYTVLSMLFLWAFFRIFIADWNLMKNMKNSEIPKNALSSNIYLVAYRYIIVCIFLFVSFGINAAYITFAITGHYLSLVQTGYVIANIVYGYGVRLLLNKCFKDCDRLHTVESTVLYSVFGAFTSIVNPCLAVFIIDSNCFNEYI